MEKHSSPNQQTNDPTKFPISSNVDSSIGLGLMNDSNMDPLERKTLSAPSQEDASEAPDHQLESTDRRKLKPKAAHTIKFSTARNNYIVVSKLTHQSKDLPKRSSLELLSRFGHTLDLFEKEIIVFIRLNYNTKSKPHLISDIMHAFNISENKANFLFDASSV